MLTVKQIDAAKPSDKIKKLTDGRGLTLVVHPNGSKYWRLRYRFHAKEKTLALGVYPQLSLACARNAADDARRLIQAGIDPMAQRRAEKEALHKAPDSFESLAREWHQQMSGRWSADHAQRVLYSLERDAFPVIGAQAVADLTPPDILAMARRIESRDALETAGRVLQRTRAVLRYAVQTGRIKHNPAAELTGILKTRKVVHQPALPRAELPAFLAALDQYQGHPLTRLGLTLLILTWTRPGELRFARWDEFDFAASRWKIPAERMKLRTAHIVPLSRQALAVIDEVRRYSDRFEWLFPNQVKISRPMSENTLTYAIYRMGYKSRATAHGFRAVASTIANEEGNFRSDVIERQLSHEERDKIRAAYHRAEYLPERGQLLQWWADFIDQQRAIGQGRCV